jgi:hypothetical protein
VIQTKGIIRPIKCPKHRIAFPVRGPTRSMPLVRAWSVLSGDQSSVQAGSRANRKLLEAPPQRRATLPSVAGRIRGWTSATVYQAVEMAQEEGLAGRVHVDSTQPLDFGCALNCQHASEWGICRAYAISAKHVDCAASRLGIRQGIDCTASRKIPTLLGCPSLNNYHSSADPGTRGK